MQSMNQSQQCDFGDFLRSGSLRCFGSQIHPRLASVNSLLRQFAA
jgi:hypothetical protein